MADADHPPLDLTMPLDATAPQIQGALKQDTQDLMVYLQQYAWNNYDCRMCKTHLEGMIRLLGHLNTMQATMQAHQAQIAANTEQPASRKN